MLQIYNKYNTVERDLANELLSLFIFKYMPELKIAKAVSQIKFRDPEKIGLIFLGTNLQIKREQ